MTEHQPDPGTDPAEAYATEYQRLWDATVPTLTAAVQLDHPQHGPVDFSDSTRPPPTPIANRYRCWRCRRPPTPR